MDGLIRQHLTMLLVGVQWGDDLDVLKLARSETHRLIGAVLACLRAHELGASGVCAACRSPECLLRKDIRLALLPVRQASRDGGAGGASPGTLPTRAALPE